MTKKTIAHYLTDLRTDLKDSGALWSDPELTRCIEKAVADYSRMVPREMSREITFDAGITSESFTTPTAEDTDYFVTTWDISAVSDGDTASLAARRPDVPRPVKVTVTDANVSITQLVIIVKGYDDDNKYIEEFFYLEGGLVQTGQHYFALVTEVEIDEIAGVGASDTIIVGTGSEDSVLVKLAYKPIKFGSVTITGRKLDTDFEMDYVGGRISMKSGGGLSAGTAYTIASYTRSRIDIDLSTIIDDLIRVDRVEYPVGQVPQQFSKVEVWGTILTLTGSHVTQEEVSDAEHLVIKYYASHSLPNDQSSGSFPSYLDTTVQLAASAYALFIKALQYEHQAVTDLTTMGTRLTSIAAIHTLTATALDKVATYVADTDTALDAAITQFAAAATALAKINSDGGRTYLTDADGALDLAVTAIAKVITYLETNADPNSAEFILTDIDTDKADLRTALKTALDAANAHLDEVDTTDLGQATVGAEGLLETGDGLINQLNDGGDRVPERYREYSRGRVDIATARVSAAVAFIQEAATRHAYLRSYIENADAWGRVATGFVAEAAQRTNEAMARLSISDRWVAEAVQRVASGNGYVAEGVGRNGMARAFVEEASGRIAEMNTFVQEANLYQVKADADMRLSERWREEAVERRNEAWAIWRSPHQISSTYALGQRGQPL